MTKLTGICLLIAVTCAVTPPGHAAEGGGLPSPEELEAEGVVVGEITFERENVFDTSRPDEDNALYRLANRLHVVTKASVIRNQLLFRSGDPLSARLLEENERVLRQNRFLYDARIEVVAVHDGIADLKVTTKDLWTLVPGASLSRSGGKNRSQLTLAERNLLGRGVSIKLSYGNNVDRESTSFEYFDKNLGRSWASLYAQAGKLTDGHTTRLELVRPFYALDARWSAGGRILDDRREVSFYEMGNEAAEYAVDTERHQLFAGWSRGLVGGWVRRWTAGIVYDDREFSPVTGGSLPAVIPADRRLVYPNLGFEWFEDRFESTSNRDQIGRTEDFFMGSRLTASIGFASPSFGADRRSLIYRASASRGFGSIADKALLASISASGRIDDGHSANSALEVNARYYNQITDKRLFFMTMDALATRDPDLDAYPDLGGDSGLRGYPLRYQTGTARVLMTAEERYFTDWYPFRLARVGGAIFADLGRTWGEGPLGTEPLGWLRDVGIGLRLAPTRATGHDIIHIDIAFPLDGDPSIDKVQFLVESRSSF